MVYDCFSFFNELDLLEIRLNTLDKVVDKFILVESTLTHTGNHKPLYYKVNKDRFSQFSDRIIHIVVDDFPSFPEATPREMAWIRENWQRNAIMRGIPKDANDDDYLIISDLDEIPKPEAVKKAMLHDGVSHLFLSMFYYFVNYKNFYDPIWTRGPQILPLKCFRLSISPDMLIFPIDPRANNGTTPSVIRFLKPSHIIKNAGWHFSCCGGISAVKAKYLAVAPHSEVEATTNNAIEETTIATAIKKGIGIHSLFDRFFAVNINYKYPHFLVENKDRFSNLIFPTTFSYTIHSLPPKIIVQLKRVVISTLRRILPRNVKDYLYHAFIENLLS